MKYQNITSQMNNKQPIMGIIFDSFIFNVILQFYDCCCFSCQILSDIFCFFWVFIRNRVLIIWRFLFRKLRGRSTTTTVFIPKISYFFNLSISNNNYAVRCTQLFQRYQVQCTSDGWPCGTKPKAGSNTPCIETHRQARSVKIDTFGWVPSRGGGAAATPAGIQLYWPSRIDTFDWIPSRGGRRSRHPCGYPVILTVKESAPQGQTRTGAKRLFSGWYWFNSNNKKIIYHRVDGYR